MDDNTQALQIVQPVQEAVMSLKQIGDRVNLVHQVLDRVMKKGTHFGTVSGCGDKMVLLKPGADVLAMTFRLVPQYMVNRTDLPNGHREYDVTCTMHGHDGGMLGQGVGSCSTMEKKYRYRKDSRGQKVENEDIADVYNTVLKMAKKRAHVDATLTVTGAADLFTQDLIEDEDEPQKPPVAMPTPKAAPPAREPNTEAQLDATVEGKIDEFTFKEGETAKGKWVKFGIKIAGDWYGTFSETIGNAADGFYQSGVPVRLTWQQDGKYRTAKTIEEVKP